MSVDLNGFHWVRLKLTTLQGRVHHPRIDSGGIQGQQQKVPTVIRTASSVHLPLGRTASSLLSALDGSCHNFVVATERH